jgi:hypothetical protein
MKKLPNLRAKIAEKFQVTAINLVILSFLNNSSIRIIGMLMGIRKQHSTII